jgi:hypothetical protein
MTWPSPVTSLLHHFTRQTIAPAHKTSERGINTPPCRHFSDEQSESVMQIATKRQPTTAAPRPSGSWSAALQALTSHWPEYLMEAALLATFMISACVFTVPLEHPASAIHQSIEEAFVRRLLMGVAMGATLIGIVYSAWANGRGLT